MNVTITKAKGSNMKQLITLFIGLILTISIFACGPAVGRAIGDAEVDVDATLADIEPESEAEQKLYDMLKEIDRLHKEERAELLEALSNSSDALDELLILLSDDVVGDETSLSAKTLIDDGPGDSDLSDLIARAKSARDREGEIQNALKNAEKVPWDRIKFLNEQLDAANAELGSLNNDLAEVGKELAHADELETKLVDGLKGQDNEYTALAKRAEEASGKIEVIGHILQVAFEDEGEEESATEKLIRVDGREIIAEYLEECMDESEAINARVAREECSDSAIDYQLDIKSVTPENVAEINNAAMLSRPDAEDAIYGVIECLEDMEEMVFTMDIVEDPITGESISRPELYRRDCYRNVNSDIDAQGDEGPEGRAAISSRDDAATALKRRLDSEDRGTRLIRKAIRTDLDNISDKKFKASVEDLLYDKSLTGEAVEDLMDSILDLAQDDLECDPKGIKGEPCDYEDEYYQDDLGEIASNAAMRLHEEICGLEGMSDDCWKGLEDSISEIVVDTADSLYSDFSGDAIDDSEASIRVDDIYEDISEAVLANPEIAQKLEKVDDDEFEEAIERAAAGLVGGISEGDNWGMAQEVSSDFEACMENLEAEGTELGDAAARCLDFSSASFSSEFGLDRDSN